MAIDNKDPHREDVFDSLQGASSLTLLKKISIAAIAIALVAFFLFWSQSDDSSSKESSQAALKERVIALEEDMAKIKDELKQMHGDQTAAPALDALSKRNDVPVAENSTQVTQPEAINLKSLFEEELKAASSNKELPSDDMQAPEKEAPKKSSSAPKAGTKQPSEPAGSKSTIYVVKKGDTLSKISLKFYGSSRKWQKIVDANKAVLGSNNTLKIGMKLTIPNND